MSDTLLLFLAIALVLAIAFFAYIALFGRKPAALDRSYYEAQWQRIQNLQRGSHSEWHVAIFEADKLLDHALKTRGFRGNTMGDRLKNARASLRDNNAVWQAHKLRNRLAHESGTSLTEPSVSSALNGFRAGLKDLGAL